MKFYDNQAYGCNVGQTAGNGLVGFNFNTWANWAARNSSNTRVLVGMLAQHSASQGYVTVSEAKSALGSILTNSQFGGTLHLSPSLSSVA